MVGLTVISLYAHLNTVYQHCISTPQPTLRACFACEAPKHRRREHGRFNQPGLGSGTDPVSPGSIVAPSSMDNREALPPDAVVSMLSERSWTNRCR